MWPLLQDISACVAALLVAWPPSGVGSRPERAVLNCLCQTAAHRRLKPNLSRPPAGPLSDFLNFSQVSPVNHLVLSLRQSQ